MFSSLYEDGYSAQHSERVFASWHVPPRQVARSLTGRPTIVDNNGVDKVFVRLGDDAGRWFRCADVCCADVPRVDGPSVSMASAASISPQRPRRRRRPETSEVDEYAGQRFRDIQAACRQRGGDDSDSSEEEEDADNILSLADGRDRRRSGGEGASGGQRKRSRAGQRDRHDADTSPPAPSGAGRQSRSSTRRASGRSASQSGSSAGASASAPADTGSATAETGNATAGTASVNPTDETRARPKKPKVSVTEGGKRVDVTKHGAAPSSWQLLSTDNTQVAWNLLERRDRATIKSDHAGQTSFNAMKPMPRAVSGNTELRQRWLAAKGKPGMYNLRYVISQEAKTLATGAATATAAARERQVLEDFDGLPSVANDPSSVVHNLGAAPIEEDKDSDGDGGKRKGTGRGVHMPPCETVELGGVKTKAWRSQKFYDSSEGQRQVDGQQKRAERRAAAMKNIAIGLRHLEHANRYLESLGKGSSVTVALHDKDFGAQGPGGDGDRLTLFGNPRTVVEVTALVSGCVRRNMAGAAGGTSSGSQEESPLEESPLDVDSHYPAFRWYENNSRHVVERCYYQTTPQNSQDIALEESPSATRCSMADVVERASAEMPLRAQGGSPATSSNSLNFSSENATLDSMESMGTD